MAADFKLRVLDCFEQVCMELSAERKWKVVKAGLVGRLLRGSHLIRVDGNPVAFLDFNARGFVLTAAKVTVCLVDGRTESTVYNAEFERGDFTGKLVGRSKIKRTLTVMDSVIRFQSSFSSVIKFQSSFFASWIASAISLRRWQTSFPM